MTPDDPRSQLRADCSRCVGLCCVAPAFAASADFAIDKPAGTPCVHLGGDDRCGIHPQLRERGFPGCTVFDCFGAGQQLSQVTLTGRSWRDDAASAAALFDAFPVMRQLQELRWYLAEARTHSPELVPRIDAARSRLEHLVQGSPADLAAIDVPALRRDVGKLLGQVSELVRQQVPDRAGDRRNADLVGADLRGARLRGASLRGAYLIAADLRGADLTHTDLLGADLRAADLRGTDVSTALFLTQPQLTAARGDAGTTIPAVLERPAHWGGPIRPVRAAAG